VSKFLQTIGIINRTLKPPQVQEHTGLKIWNTLAILALLSGRETCEIREQDKHWIIERKWSLWVLQQTTGGYKTNKGFCQNLKLTQL